MKIVDVFKAIFSDQLEKDVDLKTIKLALQFPTEDGQSLLECDALEVGQPVSLVDTDGNKSTPEDGDYEITDENGEVNVVSIKNGAIESVKPGDQPEASPNEVDTEKLGKVPATGDPIEDHPLVQDAKAKLEAARAKAKVEAAKNELDAIKGKKKDDAPVETDPNAKAAGSENPDEAKDKGPAPAKKVSAPKKLAKKLATEKPGDPEPKYSKEKGGAQIEDQSAKGSNKPDGKQPEKATPKENTVGNKYTNSFTTPTTKMSASERLRANMSVQERTKLNKRIDHTDMILVDAPVEDELSRIKIELEETKAKMKVLLSESKPLKITPTVIMDKAQESDQKLSKSDFIKKYHLGREDYYNS